MKILLLEDDRLLGESLKEYLELEGWSVTWVADGEAVFDATFDERFDIYVLDINVPEVNGLDVLRALRESGDTTPCIYVSALVDIETITEGFEAGAVDYLKKPFDPEELVLRIRHRTGGAAASATMTYGAWQFDPQTGVARSATDTVHLGEVQKEIFALLLRRVGEVVRPEELFACMREPNYNALRVTISKMKKRLGIEIRNIRGEGYLLEKL
jgi:DNA-binding response OmpR family regulator